MLYAVLKLLITSGLVVAISELSKRSSFIGAIFASLPVVSLLAFLWLYIDTRDAAKVAQLAQSIFWLVLPSLVLFLALPLLIRQGVGFYASLGIAVLLTVGAYWLMLLALARSGISL